MSTPNPCGCCCSLKTGGKVIATLDIVGGILTVVLYSLILAFGMSFEKERESGTVSSKLSGFVFQDVITESYLISAYFLLSGTLTIVFGALLLLAVHKGSIYLMKLWIVLRMLLLLSCIICNIDKYYIDFSGMFLFHDVFAVAITMWFIAVIYYLCVEIQNGIRNTRKSIIEKQTLET